MAVISVLEKKNGKESQVQQYIDNMIDHNSEAENMLRNQDLNQLEGLGTYEIKNMNMNLN